MANERLIHKETGLDNNRSIPHFDKSEVKEKFTQTLAHVGYLYSKTAEDASFMAKEADGPMQSRYDTTKTEQAWLANALMGMEINVGRILSDWENTLSNEISDKAELGSLVFLEDLEYGEREWFYIIPLMGGLSIEIEGEKITGISVESVLGENLLGKEKGHKIEYKTHPQDNTLQQFLILDIF
jgi:transcription elongation GreA/GreB family factor